MPEQLQLVPLRSGEVLRAPEVARLLCVPVSAIYEWARTDRLPSRKRGRHRLFIRDKIERWLTAED